MKRSTAIVRRTPLVHRSATPHRRVPIRPVSERRAEQSDAANGARGLVRDRDGCCILCGKPGVDAHHRLPRGGGGALWDPSRFALSRLVWLCRDDHLWVESHRLLAYGLGLLVRHCVTPCCEIPVFHHGRWVLLDDNGGVVQVEAEQPGLGARVMSRTAVAACDAVIVRRDPPAWVSLSRQCGVCAAVGPLDSAE